MIEEEISESLFLIYIGGKYKNSNIELHDVRWVVAKTIEETFPLLKKEWFGDSKGLHIDCYLRIKYIDGYEVKIRKLTKAKCKIDSTENKLWFVNLGGYDPSEFTEKHFIDLLIANSSVKAKEIAKSKWKKKLSMVHKDDIYSLGNFGTVENCKLIKKLGKWEISLQKDPLNRSQDLSPEWFGFLSIDSSKL